MNQRLFKTSKFIFLKPISSLIYKAFSCRIFKFSMVSLPRNDKQNIFTHQIDEFNVLQWHPAAFTLFFQTLGSKTVNFLKKFGPFLASFLSIFFQYYLEITCLLAMLLYPHHWWFPQLGNYPISRASTTHSTS